MAEKVNEYLDQIKHQIKGYCERYPQLDQVVKTVEEKTHIMIEYYVLGLGLVLVLMLFTGFGADIVCHLTAFGYPFYATLKCLEEKNASDAKFWLVYWGKFF